MSEFLEDFDAKPNIQTLTERDVKVQFEQTAPLPQVERSKQAAKNLKHRYIRNKTWWKRLLKQSFPIYTTIRTYKKSDCLGDIAAGLATGVSAIPIGMSYALLARFPPENGLYCQFFYCLVYMVFGTGRQVCLGVSAIEAMIGAQALAGILDWDASTRDWLNAAIGLNLFIGLNLIVLRCLGLGVVANFLADPVVSAFSTGCAVTIATSQFKYFFGMGIPRLGNAETWWYILSHLKEIHWPSVLVSSLGLFLLFLCAFANRRFRFRFPIPGSLAVMVFAILAGFLMNIDQPPYNIPTIGFIPSGFPSALVFDFDGSLVLPLFKASLLYTGVYFFIHTSISRSVAQKNGFTIDSNQELLALGLASVVGSFFQCFPVATSVARTSIACGAGARTSLYHILNFLTIALAITVLTPALSYLPTPALGSVVIFGVYSMMYFSEAFRLFRLLSLDFGLWIVCFCVTVFVGAVEGIFTGVALSLFWILLVNAFPTTGVLGRLPGTLIFRNVKSYPEAEEISGVKILRFDAALNFSNSLHFQKKILTISGVADLNEDCQRDGTSVVIVDASCITRVDVTSIRMMEQVACRLALENKVLLFANWRGSMIEYLEKADFYRIVPPEHCFLTLHEAAAWAADRVAGEPPTNLSNQMP